MSESSKSRFAQKQSPKQYASMRFLIEDPATGWRIFSLRRALLVYRGELSLPNYGGRIVALSTLLPASTAEKSPSYSN
jgi:hypothetical protein